MSTNLFLSAVYRGDSIEALRLLDSNDVDLNYHIEQNIILDNGQHLIDYVFDNSNMLEVLGRILCRWLDKAQDSEKETKRVAYEECYQRYWRREEDKRLESQRKIEEQKRLEEQKKIEEQNKLEEQQRLYEKYKAYVIQMQKQQAIELEKEKNKKRFCNACYGRRYITCRSCFGSGGKYNYTVYTKCGGCGGSGRTMCYSC